MRNKQTTKDGKREREERELKQGAGVTNDAAGRLYRRKERRGRRSGREEGGGLFQARASDELQAG